uniref:Uncharacterized protein n=1 Tax=Rangifer tarandus platyrhynchus TaxID=3082113 RepID=A0ACB0FI83_RANTA|nr:unnamed protein product [Rangifer tarandus platyrhynchus]
MIKHKHQLRSVYWNSPTEFKNNEFIDFLLEGPQEMRMTAACVGETSTQMHALLSSRDTVTAAPEAVPHQPSGIFRPATLTHEVNHPNEKQKF